MADERIQLEVDVDPSKGEAAFAQLDATASKTASNIDASMKRASGGFERMGGAAGDFVRIGRRAMISMSSAIGAATAAQAAHERSWLHLGTSILSSFAAGGPVAGTIAILAGGFGLVTGYAQKQAQEFKELGDAAEKAGKQYLHAFLGPGVASESSGETEFERLTKALESARITNEFAQRSSANLMQSKRDLNQLDIDYVEEEERLREVGTSASRARIEAIEEERKKLEAVFKLWEKVDAALTAAERNAEFIRKGVRLPASTTTDLQHNVDEASEAFRAGMQQFKPGLKQRLSSGSSAETAAQNALTLFNVRETLRLSELSADSARQADAMQRQFNGEKSNEISLDQEIARITEEIAAYEGATSSKAKDHVRDLVILRDAKAGLLVTTRQINQAEADRALSRQIDQMRALTDEQRRAVDLEQKVFDLRRAGNSSGRIAEFERAFRAQPMMDFIRGIQSELSTGIADGILDGIENGFRNGQEIARSLVHQLLSNVVNSLVGSGLSALFGGIFGGIAGGGGGGGGGVGILQTIAGAADCPT